MAFAVVCAAIAGLLVHNAQWIPAGADGAAALAGVAMTIWVRATERRAARVNAATSAADASSSEARAREILDELARSGLAPWAAGARLRRAQQASSRGNLDEARVLLDAALVDAHPRSAVQASAHADRALTRALLDDLDGALEDADAVRSILSSGFDREVAAPSTLRGIGARAIVARVLVDVHRGDGSASVARHRVRVRRDAFARDRLLFQATARLARGVPSESPYRTPPSNEPALSLSAPAHEWVARVLPQAAALVPTPDVQAFPEAKLALEARVPEHAGRNALLHMVVALALFSLPLFIPLLLVSQSRAAVLAATATPVGIAAFAVVLVLRERLDRGRLSLAMPRFAEASDTPTREVLAARSVRIAQHVAAKFAALSYDAFARGEVDEALAFADEGFAEAGSRNPPDEPRVELSTVRALALAARGRVEEARGEIRATYGPNASAALHTHLAVVEVLSAIAAGDVAAARAMAASVDSALLAGPTSLVVDLLAADGAEREALRRELEDADLRRFIEAVAPALIADLSGTVGTAPAPPSEDDAPAQRGALRDG